MRGMSKLTNYSKGRRASIAASIAGAVVLAGCGDMMGSKTPSSQLAFTTGSTALSNAAAAAAALVPIVKGHDTLNVTQITVTLSRVELKRATTDACAGDDDENDDHGGDGGKNEGNCAEVKIGAASFDLPVDGSMVTLPADAIPAGTFREFELRLAFVRLKGTFDSKPFDVTIPANTKTEIEFATPLVVTAGAPTTITVNVNAGSWLTNADGTLVDPTKIATTPSLLAAVKARIAASLRAFEDNDHDGRDDHDHGKSGHDG